MKEMRVGTSGSICTLVLDDVTGDTIARIHGENKEFFIFRVIPYLVFMIGSRHHPYIEVI